MQTSDTHWSRTPLFHAEKNVIPVPIKKHHVIDCWGSTPRLNVGNLHQIKCYWQLSEISETA
jgi:hypothetical protein